ncbi:MAG: TldD/PmbA family protein [Candidatus Riflebacteria bacterium]|nr:TldD/PmbA family protein [Candidatus Riflebacteria bacterium]
MSRELMDQAKKAVLDATRRGAKGVRAVVSRNRASSVEWRDGKIDRLRESTRMALGLTLFVDGRYSVNTTSDLRPAAVDRFLDEVIAMTRVLTKDPHRKLADPESYKGRHEGDLKIFDASRTVSAVERRKIAAALEAAARAGSGSAKIVSVSTQCSDNVSEGAMATSNGMEGTRTDTSFVLLAMTSVQDRGSRKPQGYSYAARRLFLSLPTVESVGMDATRRATQEIGARPEKSGQYRCILENRIAGRLLDWLLGQPLTGRAIQQRRSFLADKLGRPIASQVLTVTDDPLLESGLGSGTYDGEGMSARRRVVVENGVLKTHYLDTYYASKLERPPTTESSSNLVFGPGTQGLDGLLKAMGNGILITGFSGGNSNPATGDFSIGISGHWIENGKAARPVSEMNLSGNHLTFWNRLLELGTDAFLDSSTRSPSLRFDTVQFSGK